jgi:PTH1 family peptidyl-tRNA hydrolase
MIKAIIGLGNIGGKYEKTYHNVGSFSALVLSDLAEKSSISLKAYPISGFMNESGTPVANWMKMNNLKLDEVMVAHDDSDLPIGSFKLVRGGGSAGHRGIDSVVARFGTEDFWRLRIGVRNPTEQVRRKAGDFVLNEWNKAEEEVFRRICEDALPAIGKL